ncbi:diacylglycerol kinase family protein [Hydrotalea sp.]|uniref:diacylglycerol kinase family protein n=1 Tax=Hydrotalea sp. TaxID=2881279 RepID=UPI003D1428FA
MKIFWKALQLAAAGIYLFFKYERNAKIQGCIALAATLLGIVLHISKTEWIFILICIALVIALEMLNTAIEKTCNQITIQFQPNIKTIKDISAGAVLWASGISAIIGCLIFIPKIYALITT